MAPGKTARRDKSEVKKTYGRKVKYINLSDVDKFCAYTGKKLPVNGMVVEYEGQFYIDWRASEKAALQA
jgi:hypothetical protein